MAQHWSKELNLIIRESRDIADKLNQPLHTLHLLLCIFTSKNGAARFLREREITANLVLQQLKTLPKEPSNAFHRVLEQTQQTALLSESLVISSIHLVIAMSSNVDAAAYKLMSLLHLDMGTLRSHAYAHLQNLTDQRCDLESAFSKTSKTRSGLSAKKERQQTFSTQTQQHQYTITEVHEVPKQKEIESPRTQTRKHKLLRVKKHFRRKTSSRVTPTKKLASRLQKQKEEKKKTQTKRRPVSMSFLPPTVRRSITSAYPAITQRKTKQKTQRKIERKQLLLNEREFPTLFKYGRNLTLLAFDGSFDKIIGRDREVEQLVDILNKRRSNNPLLIGEAGVGKTAIAEGLALLIANAQTDKIPRNLVGKIIVELESSSMLSGTGLRGSFAERLQKIREEVKKSNGRIVLFLDELHRWIGMGASGDGNGDGAGELKTALARGELPCIGATTFDEYRKFIEKDDAFARRFQQVLVEEPTLKQAIAILEGLQKVYEDFHKVSFAEGTMEAAVKLTHRYLPDRQLPDKAINVLDSAGARAQRLRIKKVDRSLIATIVGEMAKMSPDRLLMADADRFLHLEKRLVKHIIGHDEAIKRVSHVLRRNYAGFVSGRPIGSFLFLGPTGVGKTEFAKAISTVVFHDQNALIRFDMSEFMEAHSIARLIGSPPGYIGHDAGGQLTDAIRKRPYALVLLDEIEKAHPDVLNLLIQLLDEGRLTDSRGRTVDFTNVVIIMTSNLGANAILNTQTRTVGFGTSRRRKKVKNHEQTILHSVRSHFRPELWNRIDEPLVFHALSIDEIKKIAALLLSKSSEQLAEGKRISYSYTPNVIDFLIESGGYDRDLGARPMRRTVERTIENAIANQILRGEIISPAKLLIDVIDSEIQIKIE